MRNVASAAMAVPHSRRSLRAFCIMNPLLLRRYA
jgi:hypothetical protein